MSSAKEDIHQVVLRYCRGVDRGDLALVRSAYHPDGIDHHTGFDGTVGEFITWLAAKIAVFEGTMHLVGNHMVSVKDHRAVSEAYGIAVHWGNPADDPSVNFSCGVRFIDRMERRDKGWAIIERWASREWTRSEVGTFVAKGAPGPSGSRDDTDPLHVAMEWL
jgi:SnoaL-like domain